MTLTAIDKRSSLSKKEFVNEYVLLNKPVVITDVTCHWAALGKFTPEYFRENYGHIEKKVNGQLITMNEYIDRMYASTPEHPAPYPYNFDIRKFFPELLPDLLPELHYGKSDRVNHPLVPKPLFRGTTVHELFFGGNGASFPSLHIDALCLHTQITQLYGNKEFFLYPAEQTPYLYPSKQTPKISTISNVFEPDYVQYPLFRKSEQVSITVNQGETIFFPTGWWHTTKMHMPSISYGRVHLNQANWNAFIDDNCGSYKVKHPLVAKIVKGYAHLAGKLIDMQENLLN